MPHRWPFVSLLLVLAGYSHVVGAAYNVSRRALLAQCPDIPGYVMTPDKAVVSNTQEVRRLTFRLGIVEAAQTCSKDCNCAGFSVDAKYAGAMTGKGVMSMQRVNLQDAPGVCAYARIDHGCPCKYFPGYVTLMDVDYAPQSGDWRPAADIKQISDLSSAAAACLADDCCLSFNSDGWLKSAMRYNKDSPGMCFYSKPWPGSMQTSSLTETQRCDACQYVPGYTRVLDADSPEGDIGWLRVVPVKDSLDVGDPWRAADMCSYNCDCKGFTFKGYNTPSAMKVSALTVRSPGSCFYTRNTPVECPKPCPSIPGYLVLPDQRSVRGSVAQLSRKGKDLADLAKACSERCDCYGFTTSTFDDTGDLLEDFRSSEIMNSRGYCTWRRAYKCEVWVIVHPDLLV